MGADIALPYGLLLAAFACVGLAHTQENSDLLLLALLLAFFSGRTSHDRSSS